MRQFWLAFLLAAQKRAAYAERRIWVKVEELR
jgi:hypothetical protein